MTLKELYGNLNRLILEVEKCDRDRLQMKPELTSEQLKLTKLAKLFERLSEIAEEKADSLADLDLDDDWLGEGASVIDISFESVTDSANGKDLMRA